MSPSGGKASNVLLRKSRGQVWVVPELIKCLGQSRKDLSISSLKVYLSATISYQSPNSPAANFFKHPTTKRFLKGPSHIYPDSWPPPQWSLALVLKQLTKAPFETLATTDLRLITFKTDFLVAITSARRTSELVALRYDYPSLPPSWIAALSWRRGLSNSEKL